MDTVEQPETKLPAIAETGFPVSYEEARQAIAKCESPFKCRTMADQAAAMAVYARMRDDTDLLNRAVRLQAWAARRWGELDKTLHPDRRQENLKQGARNVVDHISVEQPKNTNFVEEPQSGKRPAPPDGTTEYQRVVSRRLAAIPEAEFARQVESENPPTVTQLAEQGKVSRVRDPEYSGPAVNNNTCQAIQVFAQFVASADAAELAQAVTVEEAQMVREMVTRAARWLTKFWDNIPSFPHDR
jgi:hypothetical protein